MLSDFESMWNCHLGEINFAEHQIELSLADGKPRHSALYRAGPNARKSESSEISKVLLEKVIEPAQTQWGRFDSVRANEARFSLLLGRLSEIGRYYEARRLQDSTHSCMYEFTRQSRNVFYTRCKQCVWASRDREQRSRQAHLFHGSRAIPSCVIELWITECSA